MRPADGVYWRSRSSGRSRQQGSLAKPILYTTDKTATVRSLPFMTSTTLNRIFVTFLLILATSSLGSGQATKPLTSQESSAGTPGGIQLLEGYRHTKLRGIDTSVGTISNPGGLTINYDIGVLAGEKGLQCFAKRLVPVV